jgi:hypothetical protein
MRPSKRLNARQVEQLRTPGRHNDGDGLYLKIDGTGGKSWIFMWKRQGRRRCMGLGSARTISLAKARELAKKAAEAVNEGRDPIAERKKDRAKAITFSEAAVKCHADIGAGWRSDRHRAHWLPMLTNHAKQLSNKMVSEITAEHVAQVLKPLWLKQPDLALRLRERIEKVLDWAKAKEYREGENPAAWKGNLKFRMPPLPPKRSRVKAYGGAAL